MNVREFGEEALITRLRQIFAIPRGRSSEILVPIGDDAAVLAPSSKPLVATMDMATENVHFKREWSSPFEIGGKVTVANLSDIAAMGGVPKYLLIGLALTGNEDVDWVVELARGIQATASQANVAIVGGDVVHGESITISITALGDCEKPVLRSGARVGDQVVLSALPGFSRAGYLILEKFGHNSEAARQFKNCVNAHVLPVYRGEEAQALVNAGATSMCDVSDGLLVDLDRIAKSSEIGVELELDESFLQPLVEVAKFLNVAPEDLFFTSGEEHLFLATLGSDANFPNGTLRIGKVVEGTNLVLPTQSQASVREVWSHWKLGETSPKHT